MIPRYQEARAILVLSLGDAGVSISIRLIASARSGQFPFRLRRTGSAALASSPCPTRVPVSARPFGRAGARMRAIDGSAAAVRIPHSPPKKPLVTRVIATHASSWDSLRAARSVPRHWLRTGLRLRRTGYERSRVLRLARPARRCRSNPPTLPQKSRRKAAHLAESGGFEPPKGLHLYTLSRRAP